MVKNDKWIKKMALKYNMIKPFEPVHVRRILGLPKKNKEKINLCHDIRDQINGHELGVISFGTSSYGYDMRLSTEFMVMDKRTKIIDPKKSHDVLFKTITIKKCIEIHPNSLVLGKTIEYFKIPKDVIAIAFGKSTYTRCGIFINITPFEPEWEGYVTLSIVNTTSALVKVYANEGIAQVLFLGADKVCGVSYSDRNGKYQSQKNITFTKI
ncbi:MAG: dCTP deaminase [Endomicrobium sp.]|jgi:dCTP deaminase|nr:dCTP deaminase [Endomicrobium sp.]